MQHNYLNNFYIQEAGELHIKELRRFAEPLFKKLLTKIAEAYNVHVRDSRRCATKLFKECLHPSSQGIQDSRI